MAKKTTFKKGIELEKEFANFMKEELKYDNVKCRKLVSGTENIKGTEADIIGVIHNNASETFRNMAILITIMGIIGLLISIFNIMPEYIGQESFIVWIVFMVIGYGYAYMSRILFDKYTWVECKNWKNKVSIDEVRKFDFQVKDNNNSKDKRFKIHKKIFVAANGFKQTALQYCEDKNILCYLKQKNKFIEVNNWD